MQPHSAAAPALLPVRSPSEGGVLAVHDREGRIVASGAGAELISRVFDCAPGRGPEWLRDVADALSRGQLSVTREDRGALGQVIRSDHTLLTTAEGGAMIGSRYVVGAEPATVGALSDERLADVLRLSGDWLFETDASLALTFLSDSAALDLGVAPTNLIGRKLTEIGEFDDGPDCIAATADGDWRPFIDRMADVRGADGHTRRMRFSGLPQVFDGTFAGYRGVARDETRQARVREAAVRAEQRLRIGLTACRDGFALFDAEGILACANPQISEDLGRGDALPAGTELSKLLTHALRSGWFVECDAPSLAAAKSSLGDPANGQSMIEIKVADGRTVLFCANRFESGDIVLMSMDMSELGMHTVHAPPKRANRLRATA